MDESIFISSILCQTQASLLCYIRYTGILSKGFSNFFCLDPNIFLYYNNFIPAVFTGEFLHIKYASPLCHYELHISLEKLAFIFHYRGGFYLCTVLIMITVKGPIPGF